MNGITLIGEYVGRSSHLCTLRHPVVRLSTGRPCMVGKYGYCTRITEELESIELSDHVELTRDEEDECWSLVNRYEELVELLPLERPVFTG